MSENSKASVISELQNIQTLIYEAEEKNAFLEYESDIAFSEKATLLREELGVLEKPAVFSHFPIFPLDESYFAAVKKDKDSKGKIFKIALIVTAALLILYFLTDWGFLNTLSVLGIFATAGLGYFFNSSKKEYDKKKRVYDESVAKFNKTNNEFLSALENFEEEKEYCIKNAKEYSDRYAITYDKSIKNFLEKTQNEAKSNERIEEIEKELSENNMIVPEYYHLIGNIISNLKSGRAEDYKESLNLAIREEQEENERQIRLEQEERRNALLAMQAEEERRHNEQMERQQRERDEAVLREQRRQNDAMIREQRQQQFEAKAQAEKARADAAKQANATKQAGIAKCASCANSSRCPSHIKNNGSGLTCGGYRPYGSH